MAAATPGLNPVLDHADRGPTFEQALLRVGMPATTWEFPQIRGTLFWGPYNKDPTKFRVLYQGPLFSETPII